MNKNDIIKVSLFLIVFLFIIILNVSTSNGVFLVVKDSLKIIWATIKGFINLLVQILSSIVKLFNI